MWRIEVTAEFEARFQYLPLPIQRKAEKQEILFRSNPFHPSLHTEKIEPKGKQVWTLRIDKSYRIAFKFLENNMVRFLTVGPHDWIYRVVTKI